VNCLVDILSSATSTVTVLMDEFDAAEGKRIFSQMLTGEPLIDELSSSYTVCFSMLRTILYSIMQ
jgi:hypothetical protein